MKNGFTLFIIWRKLRKSEWLSNAVSVFLFALSVSLMSVFFLTQTYAPDFFTGQTGQRDITVARKEYAEIYYESEDFLAYLEKSGYLLDFEWFMPVENNRFMLRLIDDPSLNGKAVLSFQAARKLKAKTGEHLFLDILGHEVEVLRVESPVTNLIEAVVHGYITLDFGYLPQISAYFGVLDIRNEMSIGIGVTKTAETEDEDGAILADFVQSAIYSGYTVTSQAAANSMVRNAFEMSVNVLYFLAVTAMVISMLGVLGLLYLREVRSKEKNAILYVLGMKRRHAVWFALYDAAAASFVSGVAGTVAGFALFTFSASAIMEIQVNYLAAFLSHGFAVLFRNVILCFPLIFSCCLWMHSTIFRRNVIDVFRKRATVFKDSKPVGFMVGGLLGFVGLSIFFFGDMPFLGGIPVVAYPLYAIVIALLLYLVFAFGFWVMRKAKVRFDSIPGLSFTLLLRRSRFTAMIGTAVMVFSVTSILLYNAYAGLDKFFHNLFIRANGYNTIVVVDAGQEEKLLTGLHEENIPYYMVYAKDMNFSKNTIGNREGGWYRLAGIRDDLKIVPHLVPPPGGFHTNDYFLYCELGKSYPKYISRHTYSSASLITHRFFGETLLLTGEVDFQLGSMASYAVAVNYEEFAEIIDDSFTRCVLMNLPAGKRETVFALASYHNADFYAAGDIAEGYMDELYQIVNYVYMACFLLGCMAIAFLFVISYTVIFSRTRELMLYRVLGASEKNIYVIAMIENVLIAFVAAIMALLVNYGLFNFISIKEANAVAYAAPLVFVLGVVAGTLLMISAISYVVSKTMRFDHVIELLRVD